MNEKDQDFLELMQSKYPAVKWDKEAQDISHIPVGWQALVNDMFFVFNEISKGVPGEPSKLGNIKQKWNRFIYRMLRRRFSYKFINKLQFKTDLNYISGKITIHQIKDKYASLRVYYNVDNEKARPIVECAIDLAELASERTCQVTGAPGKRRPGSWVKVLSDSEWQKIQDKKNPKKEDNNSLWKATDELIEAVEKRFEGRDVDDLTQVFMRGPFAGLSEFDLYDLAKTLKENRDNYPIND